jgi:hypothetical protein
MTITASANNRPGVRHFQVIGDSGETYAVSFIRRSGVRRWFCTCKDFTYRRLALKRHCKHIHATRFSNLEKVIA